MKKVLFDTFCDFLVFLSLFFVINVVLYVKSLRIYQLNRIDEIYLPNQTMINEIDILHESYSRNFTDHTGEKAAGLLCVVPYHHKIVIEFGEYGFDPFVDHPVGSGQRTPVLLIQPKSL